ncbi:hypothetical protein Pmani_035939 [Petrolisthes manimaculis]|uniref:Uncharacterized protein n=1 Tax=Petrolisthes manimaculis TaxID=1843537 RepID=A0AAE1NJS5_9EUCA|nr:hypothetical protein Pmani_035939 [Petrolisthes manimaculis]
MHPGEQHVGRSPVPGLIQKSLGLPDGDTAGSPGTGSCRVFLWHARQPARGRCRKEKEIGGWECRGGEHNKR